MTATFWNTAGRLARWVGDQLACGQVALYGLSGDFDARADNAGYWDAHEPPLAPMSREEVFPRDDPANSEPSAVHLEEPCTYHAPLFVDGCSMCRYIEGGSTDLPTVDLDKALAIGRGWRAATERLGRPAVDQSMEALIMLTAVVEAITLRAQAVIDDGNPAEATIGRLILNGPDLS